jgi:hypothetical protein
MTSRSEQACKACKKQKRRCDKALPECSLCKRTQRLCEYGIATDSQPTASDWSMMQARLTELENRLANSPRATEQHILSPPISGPLLEQGSTPGATFCDSIDTHSIESNCINSSSQSVGFTPAYSTVEYSGSALQTRFPASMFLDVDCYVWSHTRLPAPSGVIPAVRCLQLSTFSLYPDLNPLLSCLNLLLSAPMLDSPSSRFSAKTMSF